MNANINDNHENSINNGSDKKKYVTVIIGAGMSTAAGIPAFRGKGGSWTTSTDVRDAFNLSTFNSKPKMRALLWEWLAKSPAWEAEPTPAHYALKRLADSKQLLGVFTQNFDGLEKKTGINPDLIHYLHGNMFTSSCQRCGHKYDTRELCEQFMSSYDKDTGKYENDMLCHVSNPKKYNKTTGSYGRDCLGVIKPNIIFFEEQLDRHVMHALDECITWTDELWVIGSSLQVYPVADIPKKALALGRKVRIITKSTTPFERDVRADCIHDDIQTVVPELVNQILNT